MAKSSIAESADLEALTAKTCSPRRFDAFVSMLLAALRCTSSSVSLDILSFRDLEALRGGGSSSMRGRPQSQDPLPVHGGKRYLILTYKSEFERVHYPLPLSPEEHTGSGFEVRYSCC